MFQRNEEPGGLGINGVIPGAGQCVVEGCRKKAPGGNLMCSHHWSKVPKHARDDLSQEMDRWRYMSASLAELRDAQWACVEAISR